MVAYRWLKERTNPDPAAKEKIAGITFTTGIYHETASGRPEFGEQLRQFTAAVRKEGQHAAN